MLTPSERLRRIFRKYDIRGVYGDDLTPDVMARIGVAASNYYGGRYAVGMDVRASSPVLHHALAAGLMAGGSDVTDVGVVPIGAIMYATLHRGFAGAYVTASHLPPEWNGVKLFKSGGDPMVGDDIERIGGLFFSGPRCTRPGSQSRWEILPEYRAFLLSRASAGGLRIVVDCGNGAASLIVPSLLREAGHEVIALNADVDPRFPGRGSEPIPAALEALRGEVVRRGADFGVAFDGDADRTVFVDEGGRVLTAEQTAIVMLEGMGYGDVVANVECSMLLDKALASRGYRVHRVPVGRTFMVWGVKRHDAVLGVESSGHYVVWRNMNMDDGILTLLYFAEAAAKVGKVSSVVPPARPMVRAKVQAPDEVKFKVVERLAELLEGRGEVLTVDGVLLRLEDSWVLVRASNTEPMIRITAEAESHEAAAKIASEMEEMVGALVKQVEAANPGRV